MLIESLEEEDIRCVRDVVEIEAGPSAGTYLKIVSGVVLGSARKVADAGVVGIGWASV